MNAAPPALPLPAGFGLMPDRRTRVLDGGLVLVGGSPTRVLRLAPAAAAVVADWFAGAPVSGGDPERRVARRLTDAGVAHPRPPAGGPGPDLLTVVVPARDRPDLLTRLLAGLADLQVVVVDDASYHPDAVGAVCRRFGARWLRLDRNLGPAGARNAGLAVSTTPFVAFVDSDCTTPVGWLAPLLAHFADPLVGAVAPRIVPGPPTGMSWLDAYEAARSPLDRGPAEGPVRPGAPVHFVPTAALVVRRQAVGDRCFDESFTAGEDVDFVWRLAGAGWTVRYEPSSTVHHRSRAGLRAWAAQRASYGATAGPLARLHGRHLAPVSVPAATAVTWALAIARRPAAALGVHTLSTLLLARRLRPFVARPLLEATAVAGPGTLRAGAPVAAGLARAYAPLAVAALGRRRWRRTALAALLGPGLASWLRRRPALGPLRYTLAYTADDLAYAGGLWAGCARARTLRPLLPRLTGVGPAPTAR